jgi:CO/xanthine dehydrogenase Mo-binding subunit
MAERKKKASVQDPHFSPDPALFRPPAARVWAGVIIRSRTPHGRIGAVVHPPLPPGWALVLPQDIPGNPSFQVFRDRFPVLGDEEAQYIGEPLALVAGPDADEVRRWADRVRFVTRNLSLEEFAQASPHMRRKTVTGGDKAAALEGVHGTVEVEGVYSSGPQDHGHLDPVEVLAHVTPQVVAVRVKTQWPAHVVASVARALDRDPNEVKVLATVSSGTANSQVWFPSLLAVHAALLSAASGRPVSLKLTKEEEFLYSPKRPETRTLLRTILAPDGRILSLQADLVVQTGAYGVLEDEVLDRAVVGILAPYKLGHFIVHAHAETSHTPPRGPVGGMGEGLGLFALESHVHDLCRALGQDPAQWRAEQTLTKDSTSFSNMTMRADSPLKFLVPQLARSSDFSRKHAAYELLQERLDRFQDEALPLRGIGLAAGFQGNGFLAGGTSPVNIEARLEQDGKLSLYVPIVTANNRSVQLWKDSAAAALQMPSADVRICPVFTGDHPAGGPSISSRAFEIVPKLLLQTCEGIAQKRFRQPLPITVRKVYRRNKGPAWDNEEFTGQPFLSFSWGAAVAEVELVPLLAEIRIRKISLLVDAGPRIDEASARNALTEGVQMAVGWAITESIHWENLAISHESFLRYRLPGPRELPPLDIQFYDGPKETNPRGLGSLGANVVAPALLAAIRQAVGPDLKSIPVSRKMLDEALRYHEASFYPER